VAGIEPEVRVEGHERVELPDRKQKVGAVAGGQEHALRHERPAAGDEEAAVWPFRKQGTRVRMRIVVELCVPGLRRERPCENKRSKHCRGEKNYFAD
jgi:hypothetical protein